MRRGSTAIGAIVLGAAAGLLALSSCGGSSGSSVPKPGALRALVRRTVDSDLAKQGASKGQIACVDRNIEAAPEAEMAERIITSAPQGKVSEAERLGPLGEGCF